MAVKTRSSNSMSVSTHLAQRQISPQGLKNRVSRLVGRSHAPTDSAEEAENPGRFEPIKRQSARMRSQRKMAKAQTPGINPGATVVALHGAREVAQAPPNGGFRSACGSGGDSRSL